MVKTKIKSNEMTKLLKKNKEDLLNLKGGDKIKGEVIDVSGKTLWIDIPGWTLGQIKKTDSAEAKNIDVGDTIEATIILPENDEGNAILTLGEMQERRNVSYRDSGLSKEKVFKVRIVEANRGGLLAEVGRVRGFLPVSQLSPKHYPRVEGGDKEKILDKLRSLVNKSLSVKIINPKEEKENTNDLIFSEKAAILEGEKKKLKKLKIGDVVEGEISGVVDFGLFVHFNNVEGLVHISEVSWDRVENIKQEYKVGEKIKAKIIGIEDDRISLSLKQLKKDPWLNKVKKFKKGKIVGGQVSRILPFGAFIEIGKGIEGLVHISEVSDGAPKNPEDIFSLGKEIKAKIIAVEPEDHKITLSLKGLEKDKKKKQAHEISESTLQKLQEAGIKSISDLKKITKKKIESIKGLSAKEKKLILEKVKD